jgi:predicted nucleic acid-binding protein
MAVPVGGKLILDTNVFVDYLRQGLHADWVLGHTGHAVRFLSSVVLLELRIGADTLPRRRAVDRRPPSRRIERSPRRPTSSSEPAICSVHCMAMGATSGTGWVSSTTS